MGIRIELTLYTDGDYSLCNLENYPEIEYDWDYEYHCVLEFKEDNELHNRMKARKWLENVLCDIHVVSSHYYILDYIYHMFDDCIKFIFEDDENKYIKKCLSGNYDDTSLRITKIN